MSKRISKMLFKTEKVELNKYDFKKFKQDFDKLFGDYRNEKRKGLNLAKQAADTYFKKLNDIREDADNLADEFGSKADDLGVEYRNTKNYKEFLEIKKIILSAISNAREAQTDISKIM